MIFRTKTKLPIYLFSLAEPVYAKDVPQPQVVVVTQPPPLAQAAFPQVKFGENPVTMVCRNCQQMVMTYLLVLNIDCTHYLQVTSSLVENVSILQWIICGSLFCFIPW